MSLVHTDPVAPVHEVREIEEGVYAYLQPDGGWCLNNAGIVLADSGPVLVDTAATEARARQLRRAVRELGPRPVDILVNTHSHGDHTFGNHLFENATVVAHRQAAVEMAEHGLGLTGLWPDVRWGHVEMGTPEVVFSDRMTLPTSGFRIELLHFGPGHTAGDAVVWLPDQRVLFTGDLVFSGATPFVLMGSVAGTLRVLDQLRALEPLVVVPGHGPVGGPELLDADADYLRWVRGLARQGISENLEPLPLARSVDLGPYAQLLDSERLVGNLARAYAEERGAEPAAPLDVPAVFGEMVDYCGAHPHCAA
ncbi:MBL fold metallo-hydrolase [Streptomyces sp. CBMA152]|uniref:MBL fold metallo-hydrolase n=1 Tax=Streptomyces sp. CBMA152 TaxID=1896312 RepID=UPI001660800F|nr:MBL fold metallo-hydrolase [Streptomyces sp. CBMA152]MBD0745897.1 MBL fold metallo-hydrolase [Streptomyces sp. CBMA152]